MNSLFDKIAQFLQPVLKVKTESELEPQKAISSDNTAILGGD